MGSFRGSLELPGVPRPHFQRTTVLGYWKGEEIKREVVTALETSTETSFQDPTKTHIDEERT